MQVDAKRAFGLRVVVAGGNDFPSLLGSLNLLAISPVGEHVLKILEEARCRPKFIGKAVRHRGKQFRTAPAIGSFLRERQTPHASNR